MPNTLYCGNRNYSSWSVRAMLLVRQSGLPCEEVVIPLGMPETRAKILQVSPSGRVPVLHFDGAVIWDSLAIAELLHEQRPESGIWPADPRARALARSVSAEMHAGFVALRSTLPMDIRARHRVPTTAEVRAEIARIEALWADCRERFGAGGDYLFGAWCAADAMYAPVVTRFRTYRVELRETSRRYADAVLRWPAMQAIEADAVAEPWSIDLGLPT
jgi:glutathione S-transferase